MDPLEILIVEDSITQALLLKRNLEKQGFLVEMARDGYEALEKIRQSRPGIIISDIKMPKMDGFTLSQTIKKDPSLFSIPIILLTALSHPKDLIRAMQSGADSFIIKPYEEIVLIERIQSILKNKDEKEDNSKESITLEVFFDGERHIIEAKRFLITHLLLSTFEAAIEQNSRLMKKEQELWEAKVATEEAYQKLKESTIQLQKLSQAVEKSPASVIITDEEGLIEYVNPRFTKITGYSVEEVLGKSPRLLKSGKHSLEFYKDLWSTITKGEIWQGEICNQKKNGDLYWESASIAPLHNGDGKITHFVAVREDITERRQKEEEFRIIIETALDGFWIMDHQGKFLLVNQAYANMTGYSKEELLEMDISKIEFQRERDLKKITKQGYDSYETQHRCKNGNLLDMEINIQSSTYRGGTLIVFARDITERKKGEERLRRYLLFQQMVTQISTSFVNVPLSQIKSVIYQALEICGDFFQVQRIEILQFHIEGGLVNTHSWDKEGSFYQEKKEESFLLGEYLFSQFCQEKREIFLFYQEQFEESRSVREYLARKSIHSLLSIPVRTSSILNVFSFITQTNEKNWNQEEISLLRILVKVISNVFLKEETEKKIKEYTQEMERQSKELEKLNRHLDQEIDKAKDVHESTLLKTLPEIEGLTFAVHYQPAQKVGGDFYFCHRLKSGNKLVIYLSDVSGHGLDGAMLSLFVKNTINAYLSISSEEDIVPEKILQFVTNQYQKEEYPKDYFICIYLLVLDLKTYELSYLGAGFQDIPLLKDREKYQELINSGLPISTALYIERLNLKTKHIQMQPGSTLFLNTDGLTEQDIGGEMFGNRVKEIFFNYSYLPPHGLAQFMNYRFSQFNQGSIQGSDDITFLILQLDPPDQKKYSFQFASLFQELERLHLLLKPLLSPYNKGDLFWASLHELLANAIEHGNFCDPQKRIRVEIILNSKLLYGTVEDEGPGFDWEKKIGSSLGLNEERERGRGLSLTRKYSKIFFYNQKGNKAYLAIEEISSEENKGI